MSVITPELFYKRIGKGSKNLLFFHGFGQDHTVFTSMAEELGDEYTCYIFDLYFHGNSAWTRADEYPLEKDDWKKIIGNILHENRIGDFSLFGYSLGAKFVFATLESFPEKINQVILAAPDGIKTSTWYSLATYPVIMRKFFKSMISRHSRFLAIARALGRLQVMDKGLIKFAELQMNTEEKRKRVYYSWVVFRRLSFDMHHIASLINTHSIGLSVVVGKYDKVIRPENMNKLLQHLPSPQLIILDTGHNNLINDPAMVEIIKASCDTQLKL
jgi:pimeloyl-ACP methyl ester carboxylesterase